MCRIADLAVHVKSTNKRSSPQSTDVANIRRDTTPEALLDRQLEPGIRANTRYAYINPTKVRPTLILPSLIVRTVSVDVKKKKKKKKRRRRRRRRRASMFNGALCPQRPYGQLGT